MENKLRKKFIYFSVGIISIVTVLIIGFVNITILILKETQTNY